MFTVPHFGTWTLGPLEDSSEAFSCEVVSCICDAVKFVVTGC